VSGPSAAACSPATSRSAPSSTRPRATTSPSAAAVVTSRASRPSWAGASACDRAISNWGRSSSSVAPTWAARSARSRVSGPRPSCASSAARHPAQAEPDRGALVAEQPAVAVAPAHDPAPGEGCGRRARARQQQQAVGLGRARGECDLEISDDPRDAGQPQRAPCRLRRDAHGRPPRRTPAGDTEHAGPHPGRVRAAEGGAQRRGKSILRLPPLERMFAPDASPRPNSSAAADTTRHRVAVAPASTPMTSGASTAANLPSRFVLCHSLTKTPS
jgi:hypothetical protein